DDEQQAERDRRRQQGQRRNGDALEGLGHLEGRVDHSLPSDAGEVSAFCADGGVIGVTPSAMTPPPAARAPPLRGVREGEVGASSFHQDALYDVAPITPSTR
ncbi:MAG: hypothetical protein ACXWLB_04045, partial [Reyranella sp.]